MDVSLSQPYSPSSGPLLLAIVTANGDRMVQAEGVAASVMEVTVATGEAQEFGQEPSGHRYELIGDG